MDRLASMAVFVKVAELGSFSAAAGQLGLSKSAVSKHVTALEGRLGVRLVNRTTRRLALTEVGEGYRDWCARIAQEVEEAELEAGRHGSEPRGRLKVSAPMAFGILHLGPLLPEFLARHPLLEIDLALDDRLVDLIEDGFDVALRIGELRDSSLIARRLATTGFVCAASPAYLARAGAPLHPADLAGHNCLRYTYRRRPETCDFERAGGDGGADAGGGGSAAERITVRLRGNLAANNGDALRAAALGGLGVVVLPDFIIGDDVEAGRLVRLLPEWTMPAIPVHAVWPPQRHPSPKLRAFVDFLAERLAKRCAWATASRRPDAAPAAPRVEASAV